MKKFRRNLLVVLGILIVGILFSQGLKLNSATQANGVDCSTCHAERAKVFAGTTMGKLACQTCHGEGGRHPEAAGDRTNAGFWDIVSPAREAPEKASASCLSCHKEGRMFWKTGVHADRKVSCIKCHQVHPKDASKINKALLLKPTETETCFVCHKDKQALMQRSSHMPIREGKISCATCHNPHGTASAKNIKASTVNELCYKCHAEKRGPFLWEHAPVRDSCLNCHDAHGSQHDKMLIAKRPFLVCQRCHITTRHPSTLYDASAISQQNSRIFNRACLNCHTMIHGSNHPSGKTFAR